MKKILFSILLFIIGPAFLMTGCGAMNAYTGAVLTAGGSDYAGAKKNLQAMDDMRLQAWLDQACTMPLGALARNATGNPNAITAVLSACPVLNMGVVKMTGGNVSINIPVSVPK